LPKIFTGVFENLLTFVTHPLKTTVYSVDAGCESSLQHRHCERQSTTARRIFLGSFDRLIFDVAGQSVVEIVFLTVEIEGRRFYNAVGEEFLYVPCLRVWKRNEGFFCSAQIERRVVSAHRFLK